MRRQDHDDREQQDRGGRELGLAWGGGPHDRTPYPAERSSFITPVVAAGSRSPVPLDAELPRVAASTLRAKIGWRRDGFGEFSSAGAIAGPPPNIAQCAAGGRQWWVRKIGQPISVSQSPGSGVSVMPRR